MVDAVHQPLFEKRSNHNTSPMPFREASRVLK
jgi:hypothetical protein